MPADAPTGSALRPHAHAELQRLDGAEIVVGIPCYQCGGSLPHVVRMVAEGLRRYYPGARALILVSDGGSTDDSREIAQQVETGSPDVSTLVTIYRGVPGKGSGLRAVFEAARILRAKAVAVFDSDLISITPDWVRSMLTPVFEGYDFVAPYYRRYKYDGTITNTIAYNLTRSLYGVRVRQPIGGDFALSPGVVDHYLAQDIWATDVARFGIDIYMTTAAIVNGFRVCQARLGVKIHGEKDPAADLGPMFRQVVGTSFQLMGDYESYWQAVRGSRDVPLLGPEPAQEPVAFEISLEALVDYFRLGYGNFEGVWRRTLEAEDFAVIRSLVRAPDPDRFRLPIETWVRTLYRYACAYQVTPRQRMKVLDTLVPLYHARVASLVGELKDKSLEESERQFESDAAAFEGMKDYLLSIWIQGADHG